jgi:hypothetical protein
MPIAENEVNGKRDAPQVLCHLPNTILSLDRLDDVSRPGLTFCTTDRLRCYTHLGAFLFRRKTSRLHTQTRFRPLHSMFNGHHFAHDTCGFPNVLHCYLPLSSIDSSQHSVSSRRSLLFDLVYNRCLVNPRS